MQCGRFSFPEEVEREFHNPPVVTVREALVSPRKRRLSITGELSDVRIQWKGSYHFHVMYIYIFNNQLS